MHDNTSKSRYSAPFHAYRGKIILNGLGCLGRATPVLSLGDPFWVPVSLCLVQLLRHSRHNPLPDLQNFVLWVVGSIGLNERCGLGYWLIKRQVSNNGRNHSGSGSSRHNTTIRKHAAFGACFFPHSFRFNPSRCLATTTSTHHPHHSLSAS